MRIRIEFDLDEKFMLQPTREIASATHKGVRIACRQTQEGDLIFGGRAEIPPQRLRLPMLVEAVLRAYAVAR